MENIKKELDSLNQKTNFILSAVSNVKENLTDEDLDRVAFENEILNEQLEFEEVKLEEETQKLDEVVDDSSLQMLIFKLIHNTLINKGYFDDVEDNDDVSYKTINEEDIALLLGYKDKFIELLEEYKNEDFYSDLIDYVKDLTDE